MRVTVVGAGVMGLLSAFTLAEGGAEVTLIERGEKLGEGAASWLAGGMLAPWCERESAEPLVTRLGAESIEWWLKHFPGTLRNGSLVVAQGRDVSELSRFARRTEHFARLDGEAIARLEPDLAGRFHKALHFPDEAHLDPRAAMVALGAKLLDVGVPIHFGSIGSGADDSDVIVDCRGLDAGDDLADLRGVKGEMLIVRTVEITLSRPVRMLHPRIPVYIVPRGDGRFMVGATMIESDEARRVSVRGMLDLLGSAYALHPAFGEAEVVEIGAGVRPAFPDNLPRLRWRGRTLYVNGLYRHGFLLAPALACRVAGAVLRGEDFPELMDENRAQRRSA